MASNRSGKTKTTDEAVLVRGGYSVVVRFRPSVKAISPQELDLLVQILTNRNPPRFLAVVEGESAAKLTRVTKGEKP